MLDLFLLGASNLIAAGRLLVLWNGHEHYNSQG